MIRLLVKLLYGIDSRVLSTNWTYQHLVAYKEHAAGLASPDTLPLKNISPHFVLLVLLQEDERFFSHGAFNWKEIRRRLCEMIFKGPVAAGSSVTQQIAKIFFASHLPFIRRKFKEAFISVALEKEFSKEEILRLYLNTLRFAGEEITGTSHDILGVAEAARFYFDKTASELDLTESLFLSGLIGAPLARTRQLLIDKTESDVFYRIAFEKLFDLLRAYYGAFGPFLFKRMPTLTANQALKIAKSPLFKDAPLNSSEYLALKNRAIIEILSLKKLIERLQGRFSR